eukprot:g18940.t1
MSSGLELNLSDEQQNVRAARRFKLHSALEMGGDIPQNLMKSAVLPVPLQPKAKARAPARWSEQLAKVDRPAATQAAAQPAMSILAPQAAETSVSKAPKLSVEEEVAHRRAVGCPETNHLHTI